MHNYSVPTHPLSIITKFLLALLLSSLLFPVLISTAYAAVTCTTICYVSPSGSDSNSGETAGDPLATISVAISSVSINGTVQLLPGNYNQSATINKPLTLTGSGQSSDPGADSILSGSGSGNGITLASGANNVTISNLRITGFSIGINRAGTYTTSDIVVEDVSAIDNLTAGFAFTSSGKVSNIRFSRVTGNGSTDLPFGRGIFFQSMDKENIVIEDSTFRDNRIGGIDLNLGSVQGVRISGNTISASAAANKTVDSGIAVLSATGMPTYTNIISGNSVSIVGRFGIEVKGSNGVIVSHNTITHQQPGDPRDANNAAENRDIAGIAVGNINSSSNTNSSVIDHNIIDGFRQRSANTSPAPDTSTGFGISISGLGYLVTNNTITNSDVGINQQQGFSGTQADIGDAYFGRDNGSVACGAVFDNSINSTTLATQQLGTVGSGLVTNLNTGDIFCSIQQAHDSATTVAGHTLLLGYRSPLDTTQIISQALIAETVIITKSITVQGLAGTVVTAPTSTNNQRIFTVRANNVTIKDVEITVNRPYAVAGIYADNQSSSLFNNLALSNNLIRSVGTGGTLTTPSGNTDAAGIALVGAGGTIERVTIDDTHVLSDTATSSAFSRGIWLREVSASITHSDMVATTQDLLYQFASNSSGNPAITFSDNTFYGAGLDLTEPNANVNLKVHTNTFMPADSGFAQSLLVKHNYSTATITINDNQFIGHSLAIFSGASHNVTISNNQFAPASNLSNYTHIQVDTGYPTGTPLILPDNSVTIYGNTFAGASGSSGRALDFQNSKATGTATGSPATTSGFGSLIVGGTVPGEANSFASNLTQFVRFADSILAPSPMFSAGSTDPVPFNQTIEGANNTYYLSSSAPAGVLGSALSPTQYAELEPLIHDQIDDTSLGLYHLIDSSIEASVSSLTFAAYPNTVSAPQTITLTNAPASSPPFNVSIDVANSWLTCTPSSISNLTPGSPQTISCRANTNGLVLNSYTSTITITADVSGIVNSPIVIPVTLFVSEHAAMTTNVTTLSFSGRTGQANATPSSASITISHVGATGTPDLTWNVSATLPSWLSCTPATTTLSTGMTGTLTCSASPSTLAASTYTTTLTLVASASDGSSVDNTPITITVGLTVLEPAVLTTAITTLSFSGTVGENSATPNSEVITISHTGNIGTPNFTWSVSDTLPLWLNCSPANTNLAVGQSGTLTCSADPSSQTAGNYTTTLTLVAIASDGSSVTNSPRTITVNLMVLAKPHSGVFIPLVVLQRAVPDLVANFTLEHSNNPIQAGDPVTVVVTITNHGNATAKPFWVDFYINPSQTPTANHVWNQLCNLEPCFGIAWAVSQPLAPGASITLRSDKGSFSAPHSYWLGWLASGSNTLALYVDSYGPKHDGVMDESDKTNNLKLQTIPTVTGNNPAIVQDAHRSLAPRWVLGR